MNERRISRRTMIAGGGIAAALGATALGLSLPRLFERRYPASAYDDLLDQLLDREAAVRVGQATRANVRRFDEKTVSHELRQRFEQRNLAEVMDADIAEDRLAEASGWVIPESLALLCALAAD